MTDGDMRQGAQMVVLALPHSRIVTVYTMLLTCGGGFASALGSCDGVMRTSMAVYPFARLASGQQGEVVTGLKSSLNLKHFGAERVDPRSRRISQHLFSMHPGLIPDISSQERSRLRFGIRRLTFHS